MHAVGQKSRLLIASKVTPRPQIVRRCCDCISEFGADYKRPDSTRRDSGKDEKTSYEMSENGVMGKASPHIVERVLPSLSACRRRPNELVGSGATFP